ncbi:hydrogenase formation protein HypD [Thermodesulfovibrionales bacterium]|nr:hydrogenase formation protein HypD [Thermodesulfovibrionales bacterium]MCL0047177.1 hydrogenase formation protein HypD [Thermodesulfovibrionales bacterium]MCL0068736.1 hydrogenase formation protein HypD [Thermodesulfovibrionales bacterium]MCL0071323.1 hydrogenase formation protein HypD [Thermodesulfovibrionales bacterium]MCL0085975.1 hydrogenase formation protein HypD [Thermodesulfovibrionales bacterium]
MIDLIKDLFGKIGSPVNLMEVCGTHTTAIFKHGIKALLPEGLKLLSGPGCPVCVTPIKDIDKVIAISMRNDVILATFGDMIRVPGGEKSLSKAKAEGADIRIIYSPLDCLDIGKENKDKKVVFFSAGFETTAPSVAATIFEADRLGVDNFYVYSAHKLVPPALEALLQSGNAMIDGFMLPGHVCTIIGNRPYEFIPAKYSKPCVITGFGAEDILAGIAMLLKQAIDGRAAVEIQYRSVVRVDGNQRAKDFINEYFGVCSSYWRGIGLIDNSGLRLSEKRRHRDAERVFDIDVIDYPEPSGCQCGLVLQGIKIPPECPLFGKSCTPERPVGACMVSSEGSCAAYYKYRQ